MKERRLDDMGKVNQEMPRISKVEVRIAMKRIKNGKAVGH